MSDAAQTTILIIDDEEAIRQSYADCLEDMGYRTLTAENGRVGLDLFQRETVDLVLVDLRMPEVDGLEVLARITERSPDTPMIVVSGTGVIKDAVEALRQGAWDYLLKPVQNLSVLIHSVTSALEKARLKRENRDYQLHLERMVTERTEALRQANAHLSGINRRLREVVDIIHALSFCDGVETFGALLLKEFGQQVRADGGSLYLKTKDGLQLVHALDPGHVPQSLSFPLAERSVFSRVLSGRQPILVRDFSTDTEFVPSGWDGYRGGTALAFPLPDATGDVAGILTLHRNAQPPFMDQDKEIGMILASYSCEALRAVRATENLRESEQQYHQAQKMESIGRLAGGVAHDLNNLLSPVLSYGEMLLDDLAIGDSRRESAEEILKAGFRARDLVRQLLAFSRKQTLEHKSLNLNEIINGFAKLLRRTIREDIALDIVPSPDIQPVWADIGQIEQVIMNLAVNAADAMPEGGRLVIETAPAVLDEAYAAVSQEVQPGDYVMLAISDTGVGMDTETLEHVFEPFFSTKGEHGTGLGLSTVYGIVKQHGGNVWVYSELGKGTTFKIYLPVSRKGASQRDVKPEEPADLRGSETILLVEDDEHVRHLSCAILERQGYSVVVARNGVEALRALDAHDGPVHLVLTDVVMPGMSARELFGKVAARYPGVRGLCMSGYTSRMVVQRGVIDEDVPLIQKPFTMQALALKVREVLAGE